MRFPLVIGLYLRIGAFFIGGTMFRVDICISGISSTLGLGI